MFYKLIIKGYKLQCLSMDLCINFCKHFRLAYALDFRFLECYWWFFPPKKDLFKIDIILRKGSKLLTE